MLDEIHMDVNFKNIKHLDLKIPTPVVKDCDFSQYNKFNIPIYGNVVSYEEKNNRVFLKINMNQNEYWIFKRKIINYSWWPHDGKIKIVAFDIPVICFSLPYLFNRLRNFFEGIFFMVYK